jgi:hypothetical protein
MASVARANTSASTHASVKANAGAKQLPGHFPVGTRYVIEGRGGRVDQRYLEFPDGRRVELSAERTGRARPRTDRRRSSARRSSAGRKG